MSALQIIERELLELGYRAEAIIHDYSFADVLTANGDERRVELAAFTQIPESYRSAAFGVIRAQSDEAAVVCHRALGAPILFCIGHSDVGVWRVGVDGAPRLIERVGLDALPDLFRRHAAHWHPQSVHRAKSRGQSHVAYQLDFVDLGLLPAIEHEVETKLDRLLAQVIEQLFDGDSADQEEPVFRITFRLLAAKILLDRRHREALAWEDASVSTVLSGIEAYYNLSQLAPYAANAVPADRVAKAWQTLRDAITFRNISSDSLAFVYENTLVTASTRKRFGTHSTPRQLAEFVVGKIDLSRFDANTLRIVEPFTGAGMFLVAALRQMGDLLPEDWTGVQRHAFLVPRIRGAEIDKFACEVATLSLILADYPNANGWKIKPEDLFRGGTLAEQVADATVILCNPPWEDFEHEERLEYPEMASLSFSKPMAVLRTVLAAKPQALGFVLPQGVLRQQQYAEIRQHIADRYGRVELVALPDHIFQRAGFEGAVLIAADLRDDESKLTQLVSSVVDDRDRADFLAIGRVSAERRRSKVVTGGDLWIGALDEIWEALARLPKLGAMAEVYRGLKWWEQASGVSTIARDGFIPGVFKPKDSLSQFCVGATVWLNKDPEAAMFPGPLTRPWSKPKVLLNAARVSRGPWRMAAAVDRTGLVASQAFFGVWPTDPSVSPEALEAIFNSPLANAFIAEHATNQHLTNELLKHLPMPKRGYSDITSAVDRYRQTLCRVRSAALAPSGSDEMLAELLLHVDAEVLRAYDLPPRLERCLLEFFRDHERERRTVHPFTGWMPKDFTAYVPLHEFLGDFSRDNRGSWALDVFTPAPEKELLAIERYVR